MSIRGLLVFLFLVFSLNLIASSSPEPVLDPTAIDASVDPCQDFYQYACGSWLAKTNIPSDQSRWDRSFSVVDEQNKATLRGILESYANGGSTPEATYSKQLGDYYHSCMDVQTIESQTPSIVKSELGGIDSLQNKSELGAFLGKLHLKGVNAFFAFSPAPDLKNSSLYIAEVDQHGLGMPNSSYYLKTDAASIALQKTYRSHISATLKLAGLEDTDNLASQIYDFELALAKHALPPEDLQDPTKLYNPISPAALQASTPQFNWQEYYRELGIAVPGVVNVTEPKFLAELESLIENSSLDLIKAYLKYHLIEADAPSLGESFYQEWFAFEMKALNGLATPPERWKFCTSDVSSGMSEALGQAYVAEAFGPAAKARAEDLISHLKSAFHSDLTTLSWLDDSTREAALKKLGLVSQKIGYPDHWRNYDALTIDRASFFQNQLNAATFETHREFNKIGGKVDPSEWEMSPQTVNAYYDPSLNQINFPAAILQPPFFSQSAPNAWNYGAIGMVIGHEMTHGFDTTGSQFDGFGIQNDWWSPTVKKTFQDKAQCLRNQYSAYEPLSGVHINGDLTITENIADQGGVSLSYAAWKLASQGQKPEPTVAGLNSEQQYFVSLAQLWCGKQTEASLKNQVFGDPHSPNKFRVIGTVVNNPRFGQAFGCPVGSPMNPANKCSIW